MTLLLGALAAAVVLLAGGAIGAVLWVQHRSAALIEAQKVVGGLPPAEWAEQLKLEARKVAIQEREMALKESHAERQKAQAEQIFALEVQQREQAIARAALELESRRERAGGGGHNFFGS